MKILLIFLLFVTVWVIVISGFLYLARRTAPDIHGGARRTAGDVPCCRKGVPCSAECAREAQLERDRLAVRYDQVATELGKIVTAGRELEPAPGQPGT